MSDEQERKRGGWTNPASATNGQSGGRLPTSFALSKPAVLYLRELARSRLGRREVSRAHMSAVLEEVLMQYAKGQQIEPRDEV